MGETIKRTCDRCGEEEETPRGKPNFCMVFRMLQLLGWQRLLCSPCYSEYLELKRRNDQAFETLVKQWAPAEGETDKPS